MLPLSGTRFQRVIPDLRESKVRLEIPDSGLEIFREIHRRDDYKKNGGIRLTN